MDLLALEELAARRDQLAGVIASAVADGQAFSLTEEIVNKYRASRDEWRTASALALAGCR